MRSMNLMEGSLMKACLVQADLQDSNLYGVELTQAELDNTDFRSWARSTLPELKTRLEAAATQTGNRSDRLHFEAMAWRIRRMLTANE